MAGAFDSEWLESLAESAAGIEADPEVRLVLEQVVDGRPASRWTVTVADGRVTVDGQTGPTGETGQTGGPGEPGGQGEPGGHGQTGEPDAPAMRLSCDRRTAEGIRDGTISASSAFLDGRLRISGDWRHLMAHRESLAAIAARLHR